MADKYAVKQGEPHSDEVIAHLLKGFSVCVHTGTTVSPRRWDILRRLGLRRPEKFYPVQPGRMMLDKVRKIIYLHPADSDLVVKMKRYYDAPYRAPNVTEHCDRLGVTPPPKC